MSACSALAISQLPHFLNQVAGIMARSAFFHIFYIFIRYPGWQPAAEHGFWQAPGRIISELSASRPGLQGLEFDWRPGVARP
jgi:hypothetical protein